MEFNNTLQQFTAKGEEEEDYVAVVRTPESMRPLGLKNCDNKLIGAVTNSAVRTPIAVHACVLQRGFIYGRFFWTTSLDLIPIPALLV